MFDPASTVISPPRKLGDLGSSLWQSIQSEYRIDDAAGRELLAQACECADRIGRLAAKIDADGEVIETESGPKVHPAIKEELAGRNFDRRIKCLFVGTSILLLLLPRRWTPDRTNGLQIQTQLLQGLDIARR